MPSAEKTEKVAALKERIQGADALLLTEYRGLSVHDATELRRSLAGQAKLSVAKNTLLERAASEAGIEGLEALLTGPTAVAFVQGDVVATAKKLVEAAKKFPALVLKGAFMDGRVLTADEAKALADLESREVMLSKIAGMLKSEMSRAASMFSALQSQFLGLLEAYKDKLPAPEPEVEATPEPEAAAAPEEPEEAAEATSEPETVATEEPETAAAPEEPAAVEVPAEEPAAEIESAEPAQGEE
jgi:large subunit ribosomal protein L10